MREENQVPKIKTLEELINEFPDVHLTQMMLLIDLINTGSAPELNTSQGEMTKDIPAVRTTFLSFLGYYREQKERILQYCEENGLLLKVEDVVEIEYQYSRVIDSTARRLLRQMDEEKKEVLSKLIDIDKAEEKVRLQVESDTVYEVHSSEEFILKPDEERMYQELVYGPIEFDNDKGPSTSSVKQKIAQFEKFNSDNISTTHFTSFTRRLRQSKDYTKDSHQTEL